eukprot:gene7347-9743_t
MSYHALVNYMRTRHLTPVVSARLANVRPHVSPLLVGDNLRVSNHTVEHTVESLLFNGKMVGKAVDNQSGDIAQNCCNISRAQPRSGSTAAEPAPNLIRATGK